MQNQTLNLSKTTYHYSPSELFSSNNELTSVNTAKRWDSNPRPLDCQSYAPSLSYLTDYQLIYKKGTLHGFFPLVEPGS
jgi:hypothetical protein